MKQMEQENVTDDDDKKRAADEGFNQIVATGDETAKKHLQNLVGDNI
jgi:hypothetical protein